MANLYYESQYFTTTLSVVGGIDDSVTTSIVLQSVTGIHNTAKPGIALFSYADPLDTSTAEWVTFTSINSTTKTLVGVTRGAEGFSAKAHANGVVVAFPHSKSHINNIADKLTGIDPIVSATLTTPTITKPIVKTSHALGTLGTTETISGANGDRQYGTLDENVTITLSGMSEGQQLTLWLLQDGTGTNTITWADTIVWQDGITWGTTYYTTTANKMNVITIGYFNSAYYGMVGKFA